MVQYGHPVQYGRRCVYDHRDWPAYEGGTERKLNTDRNISKWWSQEHDTLILEMIDR